MFQASILEGLEELEMGKADDVVGVDQVVVVVRVAAVEEIGEGVLH